MEVDHDEILAAGEDGSSATDDFGDSIVSDCFIPQIVFSTTVGYRTDLVGDTPPSDICAIFSRIRRLRRSTMYEVGPRYGPGVDYR